LTTHPPKLYKIISEETISHRQRGLISHETKHFPPRDRGEGKCFSRNSLASNEQKRKVFQRYGGARPQDNRGIRLLSQPARARPAAQPRPNRRHNRARHYE